MTKPTIHVHLDFETYCALDLKKVGVHRYTRDPSFKLLCVAWSVNGKPYRNVGSALPELLKTLLSNPAVQFHAWNAAFETAVIEAMNETVANPISCTMQRALSYGLPPKLEAAGAALGLSTVKDTAGARLMQRMSKPLKEGQPPWNAEDYEALAGYCAQDVAAEEAIAQVIPELSPDERELSQLDAAMNTRGHLLVDLKRVARLKLAAELAEAADAEKCSQLTGDAVTSPGTQTFRLIDWLRSRGVRIEDMGRDTVKTALEDHGDEFPADVYEVLQIRLRAARASNRKLERMLEMTDGTGQLRGQFQFLGAGRTGRWSGRGVQVQNLPRVPREFSPDDFCHLVQCSNGYATLDAIAPAPVLDCISWSLRSCLMGGGPGGPEPSWSIDFSQIEARVLAWLAGQKDVLAVFASGTDVYQWAARQFGSSDRQLGKVLVLALGYGMGSIKLRETARKNYGVNLTAAEAERFKSQWRMQNPAIVALWGGMEAAAKSAILSQGTVRAVGGSGIAFVRTPRTLQMRLPSGRVLYYHRPSLDQETGTITYWGTGLGGRWEEQRTWGGKLAENATQAASRDIMAEAMLRVWRRHGQVPCMTVHDELVYTASPISHGTLRECVLEAPQWAGGLPLAGEDKLIARYGVPLVPEING